jgi:hypothetical protein
MGLKKMERWVCDKLITSWSLIFIVYFLKVVVDEHMVHNQSRRDGAADRSGDGGFAGLL